MFMALMFLCRFLLFGMNELEWILLDTDLNVKQESYQVMGSWRNSHCEAEKISTTR